MDILPKDEHSTPLELSPKELGKIAAACGEAVLSVSLDAKDLQSELHTSDRSWIVVTGENFPDFNMAMVENGPESLRDFGAVADLLKGYKLPALIFTPQENLPVTDLANKEGLILAGGAPLMELDISGGIKEHPSNKLTIEPVVNEQQLKVATHIQAEALGFEEGVINRTLGEKVLAEPNVKVFVGYEGGKEPVSTVTVVEHGAIATIWNVGTLPERQKEGMGMEIMTGVLDWYADRGIEKFYLISSEAGEHLYSKIGFKPVQHLNVWVVNNPEVETA